MERERRLQCLIINQLLLTLPTLLPPFSDRGAVAADASLAPLRGPGRGLRLRGEDDWQSRGIPDRVFQAHHLLF